MSDDLEYQEECEDGLPAWLATFADLMSLLLCFFVLLLSFSEMDAEKYKQIAGSMKKAFGVQRQIPADEIPKADSVILKEYSPGKPDPSVLKTVQQKAVENEVQDRKDVIELLMENVGKQVEQGIVETVIDEEGITIRINEKGSFSSGSAKLKPSFIPILESIVKALNDTRGKITVSGHTDDVPISTTQYPSNWLLSADRAANVVHQLTKLGLNDPGRMTIEAHSKYRPLVPNDSAAHRQRNRRVEIRVETESPEDDRINDNIADLLNRDHKTGH